ncbi:MAG: phage tail tape measure protein [Chitinispirillaceae bacterium]|nr:phage tail tape measure protein [Chitinispirillaceae bacterium]
MSKLSIALEIIGSSAGAQAALRQAQRGVRTFAHAARTEIKAMQHFMGSAMGKVAALGVGFGAFQVVKGSAQLDKNLTRIGQMAGVGKEEIKELREELFRMAEETGQPVAELGEGFEKLIASGAEWGQARSMIQGVNVATAVTGANAQVLADAMTSAAALFKDLDLSKAENATAILDKLTVAGRLGNAELENLSMIFPRVAGQAQSAGLSFEGTLAFLEVMSKAEKQPEVLATMADATLRLFDNLKVMKRLERKTGINFFNPDESRRDVFSVFKDIRKKYNDEKTEYGKTMLIGRLFEGMDRRSLKGLRMLLDKDFLDFGQKFQKTIEDAGGTLKRDLPDALNNSIAQTGRLNASLRRAAESFTVPLNKATTNLIKYLRDEKKLSGGQIAGLGFGTLLAAYVGARFVKGGIGRLLRTGTGTAGGIAAGKAVEAAAGVTPVFVTNWPAGLGLAGVAGAAGTGGIAGRKALGTVGRGLLTYGPRAALPVALAAGAMTVVSKVHEKQTSVRLAEIEREKTIEKTGYASDEIRDAIYKAKGQTPPVNIQITIDKEGRQVVQSNAPETKAQTTVRNRGSFYLGVTDEGPLFAWPGGQAR